MFALFSHTPDREGVRLEGERVLLRPLAVSDAEEMFAYASDPQVTHFLPWEPAPSADAVRPFLAEQVGRRKRGESMGFAIVDLVTNRMVGSTDLMDLRTQRGQAEIGYLLARPCWGQGIMTEAASLTAAYGFRELNLGRLIAWADQENWGSRRVLEKLGMRLAGNEMRIVKGEQRPYVRYELLRAVWEAGNRED